jgi:hypothetical protein
MEKFAAFGLAMLRKKSRSLLLESRFASTGLRWKVREALVPLVRKLPSASKAAFMSQGANLAS